MSRNIWFGAGREDMEKKRHCVFNKVATLPWNTARMISNPI